MATALQTPEFVYFDLGNVLVTFEHEIACQQISSLTDVPADQVRQLIFEDGLQDRYETGQVSSEEFHAAFCEATGTTPAVGDFIHAASAIFDLNLAIVPLVAQLTTAYSPVGVLSNTCQGHWEYCCNNYSILRKLFSVTVLSYEVGCMKPDPRIYTLAAEQADKPIERIFFVDDREENVAAAREAGMDAEIFQSPKLLAEQLRARGVKFNF